MGGGSGPRGGKAARAAVAQLLRRPQKGQLMFAPKPKLICSSFKIILVEFARSGQTALLGWEDLREEGGD